MKNLLSILAQILLSIILTNTSLSAQSSAKTIFEFFDIPYGGCPAEVMDIPELTAYGKNLPLHYKKGRKKQEFTLGLDYVFSNGNTLFEENNLWGLKNKSGKNIITPTWDYIIMDYDNNGFIGYTNATCNYYSNNGIPALKQSCYYIKATELNTFIVNTTTGYGVIQNEKYIIDPIYELIEYIKDEKAYKAFKSKKVCHLYTDNFKNMYNFKNVRYSYKKISNQYILAGNVPINLKTKKNLLCSTEMHVKLLSKEYQLISVQKSKAYSARMAVCDFAGNIVFSSNNQFRTLPVGGDNCIIRFSKVNPSTKEKEFYSSVLSMRTREWIKQPSNDYYLYVNTLFKRDTILRNDKTIYKKDYYDTNLNYAFTQTEDTLVYNIWQCLFLDRDSTYGIFDFERAEVIQRGLPSDEYSYLKKQELQYKFMKEIRPTFKEFLTHRELHPIEYPESSIICTQPKLYFSRGTVYDKDFNKIDSDRSKNELNKVERLKDGKFLLLRIGYGRVKIFDVNSLSKKLDLYASYITLSPSNDGFNIKDSEKKLEDIILPTGDYLFGKSMRRCKPFGFGLFHVYKKDFGYAVFDINKKMILPWKKGEYIYLNGLIYSGSARKYYDIKGNFVKR